MAIMKASVTFSGMSFEDIAQELYDLQENLPHVLMESTKAKQEVMLKGVKDSYRAIGGKSDYVSDSMGFSTHHAPSSDKVIVGTVGVYKLDAVEAKHGREKSNMSAAQVAYWIENGTSRLREGGRKKKNTEYSPEDLITISARPFITQGVIGSMAEAEQAFKAEFNKQCDRLLK